MALTLFKNITEELTELEKITLVPQLIDILAGTGKSKTITGKALAASFRAQGFNVSEARVRKMVNYIRVMNFKRGVEGHIGQSVVIGGSSGYFVTGDPEVVKDQIESIQGRIDSMKAVVDSLNAELISLEHNKKTA